MEGYEGPSGSEWSDGELVALRNQKAQIDNRNAKADAKRRLAEEKALLREQILAGGETPVA